MRINKIKKALKMYSKNLCLCLWPRRQTIPSKHSSSNHNVRSQFGFASTQRRRWWGTASKAFHFSIGDRGWSVVAAIGIAGQFGRFWSPSNPCVQHTFVQLGSRWIIAFPNGFIVQVNHPMFAQKIFALLITSSFHAFDLIARPRIHFNRSDTGNVRAQATVMNKNE